MNDLSPEERLLLLRFVCSFAWADLEVQPEERRFVQGLVEGLHLTERERSLAMGWLEVPPPAEEVDPTRVPREHRMLFLAAAREMVSRDGRVTEEEAMSLRLLEQLLPG